MSYSDLTRLEKESLACGADPSVDADSKRGAATTKAVATFAAAAASVDDDTRGSEFSGALVLAPGVVKTIASKLVKQLNRAERAQLFERMTINVFCTLFIAHRLNPYMVVGIEKGDFGNRKNVYFSLRDFAQLRRKYRVQFEHDLNEAEYEAFIFLTCLERDGKKLKACLGELQKQWDAFNIPVHVPGDRDPYYDELLKFRNLVSRGLVDNPLA